MAVTIELERELGDPVMGIDEAGRGPLAGGVYAAADSCSRVCEHISATRSRAAPFATEG